MAKTKEGSGIGCLDPGSAPYKGHVQFRSDVSGKAGVFSTDAGKKGTTEGGKPNVENSSGKGKSRKSSSYMHPKIKGSKEKD
jgi:hypothetical protein